jgi:hypothetical protein
MVGLVLQWVGWPLAMVPIARWLGLAHDYARYIIAYNWSSVLVVAVMVPPLMLLDIGLIGPGFAALLAFVLTMPRCITAGLWRSPPSRPRASWRRRWWWATWC